MNSDEPVEFDGAFDVLGLELMVGPMKEGILDVDGENQRYRFLIEPVITNESGRASGDTIIYFQSQELVEIRHDAEYESEEDLIVAPVLKYFMDTELWETEGRSTVSSENTARHDFTMDLFASFTKRFQI